MTKNVVEKTWSLPVISGRRYSDGTPPAPGGLYWDPRLGSLESSITIYVAPTDQGTGDGSSEANAMDWATAVATAAPGDILGWINGIYNAPAPPNGLVPAYALTNNGTAGNPIICVAKYNPVVLEDPINNTLATRLRHAGSFVSNTGGATVGCYQKEYQEWVGFVIDENFAQCGLDVSTTHLRSSNNCRLASLFCVAQNPDPGYTGDNHSGMGVRNCTGWIVEDCAATGYNGPGHNNCGFLRYDSIDGQLLHCELYGNSTGAYFKDTPDFVGGQNELIQFNFFHDNTDTDLEIASTDLTIAPDFTTATQNLFVNTGGSVYVSNDTVRVRVFNNTCVPASDNSGDGGGYINHFGGADTQNYNNIIVQDGGTIMVNEKFRTTGQVPCNYNRYYAVGGTYAFWYDDVPYASLAAWKAAFPASDVNSTQGDPQFVNFAGGDYHLAPGSPCLTAGDTGGPVGCYITGSEEIGRRSPA